MVVVVHLVFTGSEATELLCAAHLAEATPQMGMVLPVPAAGTTGPEEPV